jgi:hypothetical protein
VPQRDSNGREAVAHAEARRHDIALGTAVRPASASPMPPTSHAGGSPTPIKESPSACVPGETEATPRGTKRRAKAMKAKNDDRNKGAMTLNRELTTEMRLLRLDIAKLTQELAKRDEAARTGPGPQESTKLH